MSGDLPIAVLIPTWNGWSDTRQALEALSLSDPSPAGIVVVDNGSTDGTPGEIARSFAGVEVITLPENLGFSPAVNIGFEHLLRDRSLEAILLLNNDTLPEPPALGRLWETLRQQPSAAGRPGRATRREPAGQCPAGHAGRPSCGSARPSRRLDALASGIRGRRPASR